MTTYGNHLKIQNTFEIPSQQCYIPIQIVQKQKNQKNSQDSQSKKQSVKDVQHAILIKKISSLTKQNKKLKQFSSKILYEVKTKLLTIESDFSKKQLSLRVHFQNLSNELNRKNEIIAQMQQKINFLNNQNFYLKQKREEVSRLLPQSIMEFFNKQNANILLSERNIKKWFKVLEQNLVEKIKLDLNEKHKDEKEPRLTFATSDNVDPKSKNSIPSIEQINKFHKKGHWKSFFNSELSQYDNQSKNFQENNSKEQIENIDSSFVLTESKDSIMNRQNQLYFQKTLQFKFEGNQTKKKLKNERSSIEISQNKLAQEQSNKKISLNNRKKQRVSHKSNLNLLANNQKMQSFSKSSLNQQDDQNKTTVKKFSLSKNKDLCNNSGYVQSSKQYAQKKFHQKKSNQYIFKNQLLKEYNKVLESTHQKYKKGCVSKAFAHINSQLTPKKLYFN